jgi:Na+/H+ antiporter NhaD/arsenite permease-like protein
MTTFSPALLAAVTSAHALPPAWMVLPFVLLLLCIAMMPLCAAHFWEHHYPKVAVGLGLITAVYYLFVLHNSHAVLHSMTEYVGFMALIGSLYVISGGINLRVKGEATPMANVIFLLVGAVIANIIGTTGASMLLIRPWIRMNKYRITSYHIVFFIFLVSNVGGCLTPIGDPPLFLGFLRGVPFWWVIGHVWQAWLLCVGLLLAVFYMMDVRNFKRAPMDVADRMTEHETWQFRGAANALLLAAVLVGVFLPQQWRIGTDEFHVTVGSLLMIAAAAVSYCTTQKPIHEANDFNFHPVKEVGWLFIGIFLTMIPALDILAHGGGLQLTTPLQVYFASGTLSAFLDNAPTYLTFLASEMGHFELNVNSRSDVMTFLDPNIGHPAFVVAISLGAVFFGAGSYIGNGPNFMVKAISEKSGVSTPSFVGYIFRYSLPILVPILALVGWVMLRHGS